MDRYAPVRARAPEPVYRAGPIEPWTDEWFEWCTNRYRSFNPRTGTFTGYDGVKYFCQPRYSGGARPATIMQGPAGTKRVDGALSLHLWSAPMKNIILVVRPRTAGPA